MNRVLLIGITLGTVLLVLAYASAWTAPIAPGWGVLAMIVGSAVTLSATAALGALQSAGPVPDRARARVVVVACVALALIIVAGFALPIWLPPETAQGPLWLGLPRRAAIEIYGVGLLPFCFLPFVFAWAFRAEGLDDASLAALRERCRELRGEAGPGTPTT